MVNKILSNFGINVFELRKLCHCIFHYLTNGECYSVCYRIMIANLTDIRFLFSMQCLFQKLSCFPQISAWVAMDYTAAFTYWKRHMLLYCTRQYSYTSSRQTDNFITVYVEFSADCVYQNYLNQFNSCRVVQKKTTSVFQKCYITYTNYQKIAQFKVLKMHLSIFHCITTVCYFCLVFIHEK